jgi:hypothetical protein
LEDKQKRHAPHGLPRGNVNTMAGFVRGSQSWDAASALANCVERVCISVPGTQQAPRRGELVVEWRAVGERPELRVSQEGWALLATEFSGLLRHMVRLDSGVSPDEFCALLLRLGFVDQTMAVKPGNVESFRRQR